MPLRIRGRRRPFPLAIRAACTPRLLPQSSVHAQGRPAATPMNIGIGATSTKHLPGMRCVRAFDPGGTGALAAEAHRPGATGGLAQ